MSHLSSCKTADDEWLDAIGVIMSMGSRMTPRGLPTLDMWHLSTHMQLSYPIVSNSRRRLSMPFMAAEAYWILSGSNRLEDIVKHAPQYKNFSDDGIFLRGAYGPPVVDQLGYVVDALIHDDYTRQAVLTIWRPRPGVSKDIPCTVAMQFRNIGGQVFTSVFMRSSDMWLGWPNDIFSFACITQMVCLMYFKRTGKRLDPAGMSVTAGSGHIYEKNLPGIQGCLSGSKSNIRVDWRAHLTPGDLMADLYAVSANVNGGGPIGQAFVELQQFRKDCLADEEHLMDQDSPHDPHLN